MIIILKKSYPTKSMNFYETIDEIFDILYQKYGCTDEFITFKTKLLHVYENEGAYKSNKILKSITPIGFRIGENGECILVE